MAELRAAVFDVDDTLYLERDYVASGFRAVDAHVRERFGVTGFYERAWSAFVAGRRGDTFDAVLAAMQLPRCTLELVEVYRQHVPQIALLPEARALLTHLAPKVALAAITDGPLASQRNKVQALGLSRFCDPIVLTAALGAGFGKPHPRAFLEVQAARGVAGASCAYIADNPHKDFAGPRSLGWRTVRVRHRGGLHVDAPSGTDVDVECMSMAEVAGALERWLT